MEALPDELKQVENKKIAKAEGLEQNDNCQQPVMTEGKGSVSAIISAADFAFLMQKSVQQGKILKSNNYEQSKKAKNIRRNENNELEFQKIYAEALE